MKRLEWPLKSLKYPFRVTGMTNVLIKWPKYPKNHKMSKKNPPDISQLTKIALKSLKRTKQPENLYNDQNTPETAWMSSQIT